MTRFTTIISTLALAAMAATTPLHSQAADKGVKAGTLTCDLSGGIRAVLSAGGALSCTYSRPSDSLEETYTGTIKQFGLGIGEAGEQHTMVWKVFVPKTAEGSALVGTYGGVTAAEIASGKAKISDGPKILAGAVERSVILRATDVKTETGLNVAAGVGELELTR